MKILQSLALLTALSAIAFSPALAQDQNRPAPAAEAKPDNEHSTEKTIDSIKLYSIEKKDAALKKAKEAMDDIDAREDKVEQRIKAKKAEWGTKLARKKEEELAELKKAREEVAARYQKMKEATKKTWEAAKHAFIHSYNRLMHKLDKVNSDTMASKEERNETTPQSANNRQ